MKMKDIITITTVNFCAEWGNKESNLNRIKGYIEAAASRGSNLIVFPELALTSYDVESDKPLEEMMHRVCAETIPGPATNEIAELTKKYGVYAVVGMPERDSDNRANVYNSAVVCGPDGVIGSYRKLHLPFKEADWAVRGSKPFMFETPWGPVGVAICYDAYEFPEMARYYRAMGARLFLNVTAVGTGVGATHARVTMEALSATNSLYIAIANLFGYDLETEFMGGSSIIGPGNKGHEFYYYAGKPFDHPDAAQGDMVTATVDLSYVNRSFLSQMWKFNPKVGSPDWRPETYIEMFKEVLANPNWGK